LFFLAEAQGEALTLATVVQDRGEVAAVQDPGEAVAVQDPGEAVAVHHPQVAMCRLK